MKIRPEIREVEKSNLGSTRAKDGSWKRLIKLISHW